MNCFPPNCAIIKRRIYYSHQPIQKNPVISSTDISSSPPVISATLRGARGNICALRAAQIALITGVVAWETLSLAATATPVSKHEWLCFIRARWLQRNAQVWHGKTKLWSWTSSSSWNMAQVNAVQQSNSTSLDLVVFTKQLAFRGWIWPRRFYHLATLVRSRGGWYNRILL